MAELILFETLKCYQRKCFIAFKALIKNSVYKLENKLGEDINLNTYCLKTIFLWTCETIPVDHWRTTNGWSKCLLRMIDQLYSCLETGKLPGYFIPDSNLLSTVKLSRSLIDEIGKLRGDPLVHAAAFIDATQFFTGSIYDDTRILCSAQKEKKNVLSEQLKFLQRIVDRTNGTRGCLFWKKEAVLRIFAKWCKQNSNETSLAQWQCLSNDMTLFDVVYLDIVHGFDVPNDVLMEYVDKGYSANFVCRLGNCYFNEFDQGVNRKQADYSIIFKAFLMMQHAFDQDNPTIETIATFINTLVKHKEFKIAIGALEAGAAEMLKSEESICIDDLDHVVGHKTINEFREMCDLKDVGPLEITRSRMSVRVFFLYFSYVCYKNLGHGEKLSSVLSLFSAVYEKHLDWKKSDFCNHPLLLEVYEHLNQWNMFHSLYNVYMSLKMLTIKSIAERKKTRDCEGKELIDIKSLSIYSCSYVMRSALQLQLDVLPFNRRIKENNTVQVMIESFIRSPADRIYHAQALIFGKQIKKATSLLNGIIEAEGGYSLSVVIFPKQFWKSNFLDDNLCRELTESSADYLVSPTNLYARYLLVCVYYSSEQMEQYERNLREFLILRQRYSSVEEFAPMLNSMSNILVQLYYLSPAIRILNPDSNLIITMFSLRAQAIFNRK